MVDAIVFYMDSKIKRVECKKRIEQYHDIDGMDYVGEGHFSLIGE